jgi:hypothetical protein
MWSISRDTDMGWRGKEQGLKPRTKGVLGFNTKRGNERAPKKEGKANSKEE